jgi:hypothetical protein
MDLKQLADFENKLLIPISEPKNLALLASYANAPIGLRLAEAIRDVLKEIPAAVLYRHWGTAGPLIELVEEHPEGEWSLATEGRRGTEIRFHAEHVADMPDAVLNVLVAHELAHVFQHATDRINDLGADEVENDVDVVLESWAFDPAVVRKWASKPLRF